MAAAFTTALARVRDGSAEFLSSHRINQLALTGDIVFRERVLTPWKTLRLFAQQIAHGNVACAAMRHLAGEDFSDSAWCAARSRLPLQLITQVNRALVRGALSELDQCDDAGAWATGWTSSPAWAAGGFDITHNGARDAFVAKFNANGTLAWSSYVGGTSDDNGTGIAIDGDGSAWVAGDTKSAGWTVGGFDTSHNGMKDIFVAKISNGGSLAWSSYAGGTNDDSGYGVAIDDFGNAWVGGRTHPPGWTFGGYDTSFGGDSDSFVAMIRRNTAPPIVAVATLADETTPVTVNLTFSDYVENSVAAADLIVTSGAATEPLIVTSVAFEPVTNTAKFELLSPLPDGNYSARLPAGSVSDVDGNLLVADYTLDFFIFAADANRDRIVDIGDFAILAGRFNQPGTFSQGDFNYDGVANIGDFAILAGKFNQSLPTAFARQTGETLPSVAIARARAALQSGTPVIATRRIWLQVEALAADETL